MTEYREEAIKEGKEQKNYPFYQIALSCEEAITKGATIYQKWTCSNPKCGARQTMEQANKLFTSGKCEECNQISPIKECNFMMVASGEAVMPALEAILNKKGKLA